MKVFLLPLILLLLIPFTIASALEMCEDNLEIGGNCTMVTPTITCGTYNYDIIKTNGSVVLNDAPLSLLENNVYYFNFTENEGDYLIRLCDGTTREIRVRTMYLNFFNFGIFGFFLLASLVLVSFMHKYNKEAPASSIVYGSFASAFMTIMGGMVVSGFQVVITTAPIIFNVNTYIGILCFALAIYSGVYSYFVYNYTKPVKSEFDMD